MESFIVPGVLAGIIGIACLIGRFKDTDILGIITLPCVILFILTIIIFPICRVSSRGDAIEAQSYYTNLVEPHIIEEFDDYVVVGNDLAPAVWQSGEYNLASYNSYLASNRFWDNIPVLCTAVYEAPSNLKFVRIEE